MATSDSRQPSRGDDGETGPVLVDEDAAYRAVAARDPRLDGQVYLGVVSTGVYCRPSCPARTPRRESCRFYPTAAAAVAAGFRACKRCRPDALPGSRAWDHRGDLAARAVRLIRDGAVDEAGVAGLAARLHVSERHLHRVLVAEVGTGPLQLARTRRAQTARLLVDQTDLSLADVAFAAGFASVRQFNDVMRTEFGSPPSQLRRPAGGGRGPGRDDREPAAGGPAIVLRLRYRLPLAAAALRQYLVTHAVAGVERVEPDGAITRVVRAPGGPAVVRVTPPVAGVERVEPDGPITRMVRAPGGPAVVRVTPPVAGAERVEPDGAITRVVRAPGRSAVGRVTPPVAGVERVEPDGPITRVVRAPGGSAVGRVTPPVAVDQSAHGAGVEGRVGDEVRVVRPGDGNGRARSGGGGGRGGGPRGPVGQGIDDPSARFSGGFGGGTGSADGGFGVVEARLTLADLSDLAFVVGRLRRWWDLDADPIAVDAVLGADEVLGPLVARRPGLRVPASVDGFELAVRAVLAQQVSLRAGGTFSARLAALLGDSVGDLVTFPDAETVAAAGPDDLRAIGVTGARARTVHALAVAVAGGLALEPGADRADVRRGLLALPGVGPWTADYVALRGLGDPDVFPSGDLVLRRATGAGGVRRAAAWSPWRSYAAQHLWIEEAAR